MLNRILSKYLINHNRKKVDLDHEGGGMVRLTPFVSVAVTWFVSDV